MRSISAFILSMAVLVTASPLDATSTSTATATVITVTIPDGAGPTPSDHSPGDSAPNNGTDQDPLWLNCSNRDMPDDDYASFNAAHDLLKKECDVTPWKIIPPRTGVVWKSDKAQLYYCNYAYTDDANDGGPLICQSSVYDESDKYIDDTCQKGGGGWMTWNWLQKSHFTVGRDPRYDENGDEIAECGF